jgi:hypothetical protein
MYTRKKLSQIPFDVPLIFTFKKRGQPEVRIAAEQIHYEGRAPSLPVRLIAIEKSSPSWFSNLDLFLPIGLTDPTSRLSPQYLQSVTPLEDRDLPLLMCWDKHFFVRFDQLLKQSGRDTAKLTTAA